MAPKKSKEKDKVISLWTPAGRFSFPYFSAPDVGRGQNSDNKYKTDFLIDKAEFKLKGKDLEEAVREVGKSYFGSDYKLNNPKYKNPFKDTDKDEKIHSELMQGCLLIRAKASGGGTSGKPPKQPVFIGARKGSDGKIPLLSVDQIAAIKGGDWGKLNILVFPYDGNGKEILPGVTFLLNGVQFWKAGEGFGQGSSAMLSTAEEFEEDLDSAEEVEVDASEADDEDDSII